MNGIWLVSLVALVAVTIWRAWKYGPRSALATAVAVAIVLPVWISQNVLGQPLDLRIAGTACALLMYLFHREGTIRTKLVAIDFMVLGLVGVHCLADWYIDGFSAGVPLRAYGEWLLPYFAGRLAIQGMDDIRDLLPVVAIAACVLSGLSLVEAFANVNPFEVVFGGPEGAWRKHQRWGLKRAYGPCEHPIYFAVLQLLLLPWTLYAFSNARRHLGPSWWKAAPFICVGGIIVTGSRATCLALPIVLYVAALLIWKEKRKVLLMCGGGVAVLIAVSFQPLLGLMHDWSGESKDESHDRILVDGQVVEYTGTTNRLHLLKVYRPAMQRAGLLGFGTEAVTGFPINVPVGPQDVETLKRVRYIDNAYVLMLLRFGWMGLLAFIGVAVSVLVSQIRLAGMTHRRGTELFAYLAGGTVAFSLTILTVWMPHDFGFLFLWTAGATAGRLANLRPMARVAQHSSSRGARRARAA